MENGFVRGSASSATFYHETEDIRVLVHGDDFMTLADETGQQFIEKILASRYDYKVVGDIGPDPQDGVEMTILNRTLRFDKKTETIEYEADQRHAELIVLELGLEHAKAVSTPSEKKCFEDMLADEISPALDEAQTTVYRSLTMRGSYLAQDRGDIAETVKTLARSMKEPKECDMVCLKRFGRFLKGKPRVVLRFAPQRMYKRQDVFSDSDHAGCLKTRKSTSGTVVMLGSHCVKASSGLQSTISLSSGESEYYGIVRASAIGLSIQSLMADWGYQIPLRVHTDSSAALGTCSRRGLGKLRHVQTRYLWVQERVANGELEVVKVGTKENQADMCTKALSAELSLKFMTKSGHQYLEGRAKTAKNLV